SCCGTTSSFPSVAAPPPPWQPAKPPPCRPAPPAPSPWRPRPPPPSSPHGAPRPAPAPEPESAAPPPPPPSPASSRSALRTASTARWRASARRLVLSHLRCNSCRNALAFCRLPICPPARQRNCFMPFVPTAFDLAATDTVFDLAATDTVFDLAATDTVFDLAATDTVFDLAATDIACHHVRARAAQSGSKLPAEDLNSEARKPGRQADAEPSRFEFKASAKLTYIMSEAEEAAVEAWLDSHPDFFEDYFHRRGSRGLVDGWLRRRLAATSSAALGTVQLAPRSLSCSVGSGRLLGQRSHRIRKASSELHADEGSIGRTSPAMPRRHALPALTEEAATAREMMLSSLLMELDSGRLRRRIVRACRLLLAADRCALFLAEPGGWLRLTADTVAAEAAPTEPEVRVPPGVGIVGNAAATGQTLRLEEAAKDPRFNAAVDELPSCATVRALAAPLKHPDGGSIGLLLATSGGRSAAFTDAHEKSLQTFLALCSASLRIASCSSSPSWKRERNEVLLDLVRITFEHMENLELLVNNILQYMRLITRCTWCQILLIDDPSSAEGSFDRVFELLADEADGTDKSAGGAAGRAVPHPVAALPARPQRPLRAVGPLLLMNPADGRAFSESDANLAEAFALFCGLGIHSVRQRELAETAQKRQRVALEVLGYHAAAGQEEAQRLARSLVPSRPVFRHRPAGVRRV
uniref:GAF domain-containing protein n=1 Tax=Macrostomum lignano TaxID=282301 RepID=A0A1I8IY19_9PLAT